MENKKNALTIILIIIIVTLCCIIGWLLGSKFASVESEAIDSTNNEQEPAKQKSIQFIHKEKKLN